MTVGSTHYHRVPTADARRPFRLAVTLVVAGGLAITGGCAGAPAPAPPLPTAGAPALVPPSTGNPADVAPPAPTTEPTPTGSPGSAPTTPRAAPPADPASQTFSLGDSGPAVRELQQQLRELGYWIDEPTGHYGQLTRQAVMAFQKVEGLSRDGVAGPRTRDRLPDAERPEPRNDENDGIEVDLERQLLLVVRDGKLKWAFNTSTGSGEDYDRPSGGTGVARTPRGEFEIERQIDGVRKAELGDLYRPKYFHGGIAVHGSGSIPAQPASHGCVRLTNAAMDLLWSSGVAEIGTDVIVY
jgi:putative peptidoglycan binding protein/L,D-transpeptidase-like protein